MPCTSFFASSALSTSRAAIRRSARGMVCIVIVLGPAILADSRGLTLQQTLERKIEGLVRARGELFKKRPNGLAGLCARAHFAVEHELGRTVQQGRSDAS